MSDITKRALSASLKSLLLEKPIDKVSVLDITNRCGVKRQTFYLSASVQAVDVNKTASYRGEK